MPNNFFSSPPFFSQNNGRQIFSPQKITLWLCYSILGNVPNDLMQKFREISGEIIKEKNKASRSEESLILFSIECLTLPSPEQLDEVLLNLDTLVSFHADYIKNLQPQGPYYLAGWSFGGKLASLIAHKLKEENREIAFLCVIDTSDTLLNQLSLQEKIEEFKKIYHSLSEYFGLIATYPQPVNMSLREWLNELSKTKTYRILSHLLNSVTDSNGPMNNLKILFEVNATSNRSTNHDLNDQNTIEFSSTPFTTKKKKYSSVANIYFIDAPHDQIYKTPDFTQKVYEHLIKAIEQNTLLNLVKKISKDDANSAEQIPFSPFSRSTSHRLSLPNKLRHLPERPAQSVDLMKEREQLLRRFSA